jgi:predicted lysophospholipase L1 biosynthesis ABC-type transport system permease subunit
VIGREFGDADAVGTPKVAVVNEAFVRHFLPGRNPVGQRFARGVGDVVPDIEIVGVVKDAKYSSMREPLLRIFYTASRQAPGGSGRYFYLRTATEPESLFGLVRTEVGALAADHPVRGLKTMQQQIEANVAGERLVSVLTGAFGALATLLASIGLYGVLSYNVARRTREIGIRIALGADPARVRGILVREVAITLLTGTALGAAAAIGVGTLLRSLLYEMKPFDPTVYTSMIAILATVALAAAYVPARRASRIDPMLALRHD